MKWYPWLDTHYKQILYSYQQGRKHHTLLLHSCMDNGQLSLCYALSRWLMCLQPNGKKSCNVCYSCNLMKVGNHPDFYQLKPEKEQHTIGIDNIRNVINNIYKHTIHNNAKVILLTNTEQLTEQATNALLKIIEEPPKNTYFFLICKSPLRLLSTLRSRCLYWLLPPPDENVSLKWLQKIGYKEVMLAKTALRLCSNFPLAAEVLLQPVRWQARVMLCITLQDILIKGNFLTLLPILNQDKEDNEPIYWLLSLLTDALKWQQGAEKFLINVDKTLLITKLALSCSTNMLHHQWYQWLRCLHRLQKINGINRELLFTYYLLNWEYSIDS